MTMAKKEVYKIYLFRHGQTYFNRDHKFTGWKDSKLTSKGIKDAKKVAHKLKNKEIDIAYKTRLSRSKDTLKEVLKFHPKCKTIIVDDRMIERCYGTFQGLNHTTIIKKYGKEKFDIIRFVSQSFVSKIFGNCRKFLFILFNPFLKITHLP